MWINCLKLTIIVRKRKINMKHKHFDIAQRAHSNTSFSPEKRAQQECDFFDEIMQEFHDDENVQNKFESLFISSLSAKSRCASTMITGGSNFNVARNEKALKSEMNKTQKMFDFLAKARKAKEPKIDFFVKSNDPEAIEKLHEELERAKNEYKLIKSIPKDKREHSFSLAYALDKVKRLESRIASLSTLKATENVEKIYGDVRVVWNYEMMRLQLFFNDKPPQDMILKLKKSAFRWSPTVGCWQRQLTRKAEVAASEVLNICK